MPKSVSQLKRFRSACSALRRHEGARCLAAITAAIAFAGTCSAQSTLAIGSGSGIGGAAISVNLSVASATGAEPSALEWTLSYPAASILSVTFTASPALTAAGKSLVCGGGTCLVYGINATPIPSGTVATAAVQLAPSASGSLQLHLSNASAATGAGDALIVSATDGSVLAHPAPTGALAQIADGGTLVSGIFVLNTTATTANYSIRFYDDTGNFLTLPFATGPTSLLSGTLPPHGSVYIETTGTSQTTVDGSGQITADTGVVVQALFRNLVSGVYYEAAVPSTAGGKQIMFPYDDTTFATNGQPFVTGIAIANLDGGTSANVVCTAYRSDGSIVPNAFPVPSLPANGHWAGYQFPNLVGLRGTIQCTSNTNLSATALRFLGNEISSLPVVTNPATSNGATQTAAIAQVAAGGTLTTDIFVLNGGSASTNYTLNFYGDNGQPLAAPFSSISGTLAGQGSTYIEEASALPDSLQGWAQISAGSSVVVQALFRNAVNGIYYEAAIPSTPGSKEFLLPFDSTTFAGNGQPLVTGIAIANLDNSAANIVCTAYDPTGTVISGAVIVPSLAPLGHWAAYQFPLLVGKRGTIDCKSNTNVSATALRFLGSALSSLPVVTE
jgi:hypothetical protein